MVKKQSTGQLTEVELELMNILWRLREGTVRDILAELPAGRTMAYTSASTIIRILEKKGVVQSRAEGKSHIYSPILEKSAFEALTLTHVIENVFDGTPTNLVKRLIGDEKIPKEDLDAIRKMLEEDFK